MASSKKAMSSDNLAKQIMMCGQNKKYTELQELIAKCDVKLLERAMVKRIDRSDAVILWNFVLIGLQHNSDSDLADKLFSVLTAVFDEMNKVEITSKQTFDLVTRTFIDLPKLRVSQLIHLVQYCIDSLRIGDNKCLGWKELFPELMKLLGNMPKVIFQNEVKTGNEFYELQMKRILETQWPEAILSSIGAMFLEMPISKNDRALVMRKLCENILKLEPHDLPTLAFQLFTLSTTPAQLMIPLFSLNQYFTKYLYQKQFDETDSELRYDSIDRFSDNDLQVAQNTVLYHLSNCSEYKINEKEFIQQIRTLASNPKYILSPFMLSAILTICNVNRYLESVRLSVSSGLTFIRTVIQNNEKEVELCSNSAWFRNTLEHSTVNVQKVYSILVDQSKEDIYTPGLIGMAFVLLKTPNYSNINVMGIHFLEEMVKARHQLGYGILRNLKEFLFADQDAAQYAECLTKLSINNPMIISEHIGQIKEIIDFFLLIPGHHAMRMMNFILPLTKINIQIREYFIDMLRQAMYQSNTSTRQMAVHGFTLILKQLRNNSTLRSSARSGSTQLSISGFSMMSQQMLLNENNPNMTFDMCVLEIIGILRKCFNQTYEVKEILYDGLIGAIQQNPKLIPRVLQFCEWHFRSCFTAMNDTIKINSNKMIVDDNLTENTVNDHIGKLAFLVAQCLILTEQHGLEYESDLKNYLEELVLKVDTMCTELLESDGANTVRIYSMGSQFVNFLEVLMYYCLKMQNMDVSPTSQIHRLFQLHKQYSSKVQESLIATKKLLKKKTEDGDSLSQVKANSQITMLKTDNIWDLIAVHGFLSVICRTDLVSQNHEFCMYIVKVVCNKIEQMRTAPEYKQTKYSKSNFKYLCDLSALILKYFIKNLPSILNDNLIEMAHSSVNCFRECLITTVDLYQRKFTDYLKVLVLGDFQSHDININLINILQNVLEKVTLAFENDGVSDEYQNILQKLFHCLEILYNNIPLSPEQAKDVHNWLYNYCKTHSVEGSEQFIVHKLLFNQRVRTLKGSIFEGIAKQIETQLGQIQEEAIEGAEDIKSINLTTCETCVNLLFKVIRKQIEDVEYFIMKVKSYCIQIKTGGQNEEDRKHCENRMITIERRICTELIFISRTCIHLANALLPLGSCMEDFTKLLSQLYVCLANLTKHFINHQKITPISYKSTKFDQLVDQIGKRLPLKVYAMISYIEDNIFENENDNDNETTKTSNRKDARNQKARVMRETKNIPKLILRIENFNKFVISLSKKTEHDLNKCLHMGTVRDFRIKTGALREAIEKLQKIDASENEDSSDEDEDEDESKGVNVMDNLETSNKRASKRKKQDIDDPTDKRNKNNSAISTVRPNTRQSNRISNKNI